MIYIIEKEVSNGFPISNVIGEFDDYDFDSARECLRKKVAEVRPNFLTDLYKIIWDHPYHFYVEEQNDKGNSYEISTFNETFVTATIIQSVDTCPTTEVFEYLGDNGLIKLNVPCIVFEDAERFIEDGHRCAPLKILKRPYNLDMMKDGMTLDDADAFVYDAVFQIDDNIYVEDLDNLSVDKLISIFNNVFPF